VHRDHRERGREERSPFLRSIPPRKEMFFKKAMTLQKSSAFSCFLKKHFFPWRRELRSQKGDKKTSYLSRGEAASVSLGALGGKKSERSFSVRLCVLKPFYPHMAIGSLPSFFIVLLMIVFRGIEHGGRSDFCRDMQSFLF